MNVTFLLGNGFDKAIGLPTSYPEFYDWYLLRGNRTEDEANLKATIKKSIDNGDGNWSDFEYALGQFTAEFNDKNRFIECFKLAKSSLMEYLDEVYDKAKDSKKDFIESASYCLARLSLQFYEDLEESKKSKYKNVSNTEDLNISYISFNYTPLLPECHTEIANRAKNLWTSNYYHIKTRCEVNEHVNVHGIIDNNPILGVDNISQIANEKFRQDQDLVRLIVKGEADKVVDKNWRANAVDIISNSNVVCIFGMSLGDTDLFWWKQLASWLESNEQNELIIFCFVKPEEKKEEKECELRSRITAHLVKIGFEEKIIVDSVMKRMTVEFVPMRARSIITTQSVASMGVAKVAELTTKI